MPAIKVRGPLGCHIWRGATTQRGYPVAKVNGKMRQVRRLVYEREKRPLLPGERVTLACGERLCINPAHFEAKHAAPR